MNLMAVRLIVRAGGCPPPHFLSQYPWVDLTFIRADARLSDSSARRAAYLLNPSSRRLVVGGQMTGVRIGAGRPGHLVVCPICQSGNVKPVDVGRQSRFAPDLVFFAFRCECGAPFWTSYQRSTERQAPPPRTELRPAAE